MQVFPLRDGKLVDRYAFHLENVAGQDAPRSSRRSASSTTAPRRACRRRSSSRAGVGDTAALAEFLSRACAARASRCGRRSAARSGACELATRTRRSRSSTRPPRAEQKRLRRVEALEELREALNLESLPLRIECFDISNIQGREIVASMVVFEDAQPKKAHYRKFAVRGLEGQDDFAAMAEVVARRFARLRDASSRTRYDESFAAVPNLVVVDGGKGQLSAALEAIQATSDLPRVAVISLAKREEEVFVPGRSRADPARPPRRRPSAPAADPRRGAPLRARLPPPAARHARVRVDLRRRSTGSAPRGGGRSCSTSARPSASSPRQEELEGVPGCRRRRRAPSTRSSTRPAAAVSAASGAHCDVVRRLRRLGVVRRAAEAERAEREQDRGEPDDDVDDA